MNKPSEMPRKLASVNDATVVLDVARERARQLFVDTYGDTIGDVKEIMGEFKDHDPTTAAVLALATVMLTPEEY